MNERQTIDNYEIVKELGRGGMGVVYQARQVSLNRLVALKMILAGPHASSEARQRFLREAKTAAAAQHPNIVQVFDLGEHDGHTYFVMEYVDGTDLHSLGALPPRRAAELVEQIARAVHHAHEQGVIHRDLKPANVLLDRHGTPKVTDFGVAKLMQEDEPALLTAGDQLMGTAPYMSPEQARGDARTAGPEADVYGLGAILYQLLTSQPPFLGRTTYEVLKKVQNEDPWPPRRLVAGIPRDLETICLKCLQKPPMRRYSSAADLADDLRRFLDGDPIQARRTSRLEHTVRWIQRSQIAKLMIVALVLASGIGAWRWRDHVLHRRPDTRYFRTMVLRNGEPTGIGPLQPAELKSRNVALQFTTTGKRGPVQQITAVNAAGYPVPTSQLASILDAGRHNLADLTVVRWSLVRDMHGELTKVIARDRSDRELWSFLYTRFPTKAHYVDRYGNERSRTGTGSAYVEFGYSDSGYVQSVRFLDANSLPQSNRDGSYGMELEIDQNGRLTGLAHVGQDGQPIVLDGYVHRNSQYDDEGNITQMTFLDRDGALTNHRNGYAQVRYTYDECGNQIDMAYYDSAGQSVEGIEGYARTSRNLDAKGNVLAERYYDATGNPTFAYEGMAENRFEWNDSGQIVRETYHDEQGKAIALAAGYAAQTRDYDSVGNLVQNRCYDRDGNPVLDARGVHRTTTRYDDDGHILEFSYFDTSDQPTATMNGWARILFGYDRQGNRISRQYLGVDGDPFVHKDGNSGWRGRYDLRGNLIEQTYLDAEGAPVTVAEGYATSKAEFDGNGNFLLEYFLDADGKPAVNREGWHRVVSTFNDRDGEIERRYYDGDGRPTWHKDGYSSWKADYDERGNLIEKAYFDPDGKPTLTTKGFARQVTRHDHRGLVTEETYFDEQDHPTPTVNGAARVLFEWNPQGNLIRETRYDARGNPVGGIQYTIDHRSKIREFTHVDGFGVPVEMEGVATFKKQYNRRGLETEQRFFDAQGKRTRNKYDVHREVYEYDSQGRVVEGRLYDEQDKLTPHGRGGHARMTKEYDVRGNLIREAYYDANNEPFLSNIEGFAFFTAKYDRWGNRIEWSLFGVDGEPILGISGYHLGREQFERGQPVESAYFGIHGEPVMTTEGFARMTRRYDDQLREIESTMFDASGAPTTEIGWATERTDYDSRGNAIQVTYWDADGKPALGDWGYATVRCHYDAWNREIENAVFDGDENPVARTPEQFWRVTRRYDSHGNVVQERYFDSNGNPTRTSMGVAEWTQQFGRNGISTGRQYFDENGERIAVHVLVTEVRPNSPAEQAGIQAEDILLRYNDQPISDMLQFLHLRAEQANLDGSLQLERGGQRMSVPVPTGELGITLRDDLTSARPHQPPSEE